jgi:cytochrome c553
MVSLRELKTVIPVTALAALLFAPANVAAQEGPADPTDMWDVARGGQLYDNWMSVLEHDAPEGSHPLYPAEGAQSGAGTWRCKECHGWDYIGKDGAYGGGSHFTGIIGITGASEKSEEEIAAIIMSPEHGYTSDMLPPAALEKLVRFVKSGPIDTDPYINRADKTVNGDPANGARMYQTICAVCHGFDGTDYNFGSAEEPEYVGTIGADNPWEGLHKIRFGQPGVPMIAMTALETQQIVDILAYIQTLPTK